MSVRQLQLHMQLSESLFGRIWLKMARRHSRLIIKFSLSLSLAAVFPYCQNEALLSSVLSPPILRIRVTASRPSMPSDIIENVER